MKQYKPLAERMRPETLSDYMGQGHLLGNDAVLKKSIDSGNVPSLILWGPPGVGKTTLAYILANELGRPFFSLSAINAGVKDVREVIEQARALINSGQGAPVLFIDEIHRFSKNQQDALLGAVEKGWITLIGATTENPSFEVISPLLSRCQVYTLKSLSKDNLVDLLNKAIREDEEIRNASVNLLETNALLRLSGGDARKLLNTFEIVVHSLPTHERDITDDLVLRTVQQNMALYDKAGEMHYDIISAFIKSIRGSDPNAAMYWLARMIKGGEDPSFIARRLLILASEDIGNANPTAMVIANNCFQAVNVIGWPESRIILAQTVAYLAASEKSNASYMAINDAQALVDQTGDLPVPLHIRNAPTGLMKELGYGKNYKYSHDYSGNFKAQEYLPDQVKGVKLYDPSDNPRERELRNRLKSLWKDKYGY